MNSTSTNVKTNNNKTGVVIVKFQVTNPNLLGNIPLRVRDEEAIIAKRADSGFQNQNVRKDVIDTGNHREYQNVSVSKIIDSMRRDSRPLSDLHYFVKKDDGKSFGKKYVVVATFAIGGTKVNGKALEDLIESGWKHCHVWFNPDGSITVNNLHRIPADQRPANNIKELEIAY
jgi:hypothetical protein